VIPSHLVEYWLFGLLFAIIAPLQLAWAELVRRRPDHSRLLLIAGLLMNLGVVAVWVASRTTGLPVGPHAGQPEPVGWKDLLATTDEIYLVLAAGLTLARVVSPALIPIAWTCTLASIVAAIVPGGHA
jgi:hypothetical protein